MALKPAVLLIHGGGFVIDGEVDSDAEDAAVSAGAQPVQVRYPLDDVNGAMEFTIKVCRWLARARAVYAYGESAGACLAARMAQMRYARRAVGLFTVPDLVHLGALNPTIAEMIRSAGGARERRWASPGLHTTYRPVLAQISDVDAFIPFGAARDWADGDVGVSRATIPCTPNFGHGAPVDRPGQLAAAMDFLLP